MKWNGWLLLLNTTIFVVVDQDPFPKVNPAERGRCSSCEGGVVVFVSASGEGELHLLAKSSGKAGTLSGVRQI
jgi:hypothetical protein